MQSEPGRGPETFLVDARGEKCPLPVLRTEKMLARLDPGERLTVLATDPVARIDIALYCKQHGHGVELSEEEGVLRFEIVCGGAS